jgi:DNA-binding FadR family transcriptional regulator
VTKLAVQIARRIEDRIITEGWAVGTPLGTEADLSGQFGVSRWTLREALRILERDGLVVSRRGGGGGLFIAAPVADFVCNGLSHYLEYAQADLAEIWAAWSALEGLVVELADRNMDDAERAELRELGEAIGQAELADAFVLVNRARAVIATAAGNSALTLLTRALSQMAVHASWYSALDDDTYHAVFPAIVAEAARTARALAEGNLSSAREHGAAYLSLCMTLLESSYVVGGKESEPGRIERAYRLFPAIRPHKKADEVAARIRDMIIDANWPVGLNLGTETELLKQFGVGRGVLREAIRSLERLGVVKMGRGSASGLTVIAPSPQGIVESCRRHLRRTGATDADVALVRDCLSAATVDGASAQATRALTELYLTILDQEGT